MSQTYPQYPDTTFPDAVQQISSYLDIASTDLSLYTSYIGYIYAGNYNAAQAILQQIPDFNKKVLTAQKLNQLTDTIMALQTLYSSAGWQQEISTLQSNWLAIINQFQYKGVWSASTTYLKNSMVKYQATGVGDDQTPYLYIATQNVTTTDNPYTNSRTTNPQWIQLTMRGVQGDAGIGMNFMFDWNATTQYSVDSVVVYNDAWWGCIVQNINQTPALGSSYWKLLLSISTVQIPVQATQPSPTAQAIGDLWFQVI